MTEHVKRWRANVFLVEEDAETTAHAVVETGVAAIHGYGKAKRNPDDTEIEGIGDELATGRAFIDLGRRLLGITEEDLEAVEGRPAHVHE